MVGEMRHGRAGRHLGGDQWSSQMILLQMNVKVPLQVVHDEDHPLFALSADTLASPCNWLDKLSSALYRH